MTITREDVVLCQRISDGFSRNLIDLVPDAEQRFAARIKGRRLAGFVGKAIVSHIGPSRRPAM